MELPEDIESISDEEKQRAIKEIVQMNKELEAKLVEYKKAKDAFGVHTTNIRISKNMQLVSRLMLSLDNKKYSAERRI